MANKAARTGRQTNEPFRNFPWASASRRCSCRASSPSGPSSIETTVFAEPLADPTSAWASFSTPSSRISSSDRTGMRLCSDPTSPQPPPRPCGAISACGPPIQPARRPSPIRTIDESGPLGTMSVGPIISSSPGTECQFFATKTDHHDPAYEWISHGTRKNRQLGVHLGKQFLGQLMLLQQMPEVEDRRLIGDTIIA